MVVSARPRLLFLVAERRGRLDEPLRRRVAAFLHALPITLDAENADQAWTAMVRLAERFNFSTFDAAYLELAQPRRLPLATLYRDLQSTAAALGFKFSELNQHRRGTTGRHWRRGGAPRRPARRG